MIREDEEEKGSGGDSEEEKRSHVTSEESSEDELIEEDISEDENEPFTRPTPMKEQETNFAINEEEEDA